MAQQSIQELQRDQICRMLSLGASGEQAWGGAQTFKVLVYDKFCQEVIAPLLKVGGLRKEGVSINVRVDSDRGPMPDVPAVYFVEPTEENVRRIIQDLQAGLYESVYVNFASSVNRPFLQELAKGALQANAQHKVAGVFDRFVSFVSLSANLFSLSLPKAYATIQAPGTSEQFLLQYIDRIVDGLLSVLITLGALPVIRCPANEPVAEAVARGVCKRIHDMLQSGAAGAELFSGAGARGADSVAGGQRPLLCILDRNIDLVTMLNHTWTYQAMAHDFLNMRLNKITIPGDKPGDRENVYDVDESDAFWAAHAGEPFPNAACAASEAFAEWNKKRQQSTQSEADADDLMGGLSNAFNALPEMREKKRSIDMHTNIATALMSKVKDRELANYFELEEQFPTQSWGTSVSQVTKLLSEAEKGTEMDKLRALMVLYLSKPSKSPQQQEDLQKMVEALERIGGDASGLSYLQYNASIREMMVPQVTGTSAAAPSSGSGPASAASLMNSFFSKGEGILASTFNNIQNVMASQKKLVICEILEGLMEQKPGAQTENYLYLDPKVPMTSGEVTRIRAPFRKAMAFMIGGGNYAEMQSVQEWATEKGRHVVYGSTDLVSPEDFVAELNYLGRARAGSGRDGVDLS